MYFFGNVWERKLLDYKYSVIYEPYFYIISLFHHFLNTTKKLPSMYALFFSGNDYGEFN